MRSGPLSPSRLLRALELFGPQARPYNFDGHFDCWGLAPQVFDWVDDGFEMNQEAVDKTTVGDWQEIGRRGGIARPRRAAPRRRPEGLPFYCRRQVPRDACGREVYDNAATRHLDYHVPDGAPVPHDLHEVVMERSPREPV